MAGRHKIFDLQYRHLTLKEWARVRSYERKEDALAAGLNMAVTQNVPVTHIRVVNITNNEVTYLCNQGDNEVKKKQTVSECEAFLEIKFDDGASVRKLGPLTRENASYIYDTIKRSTYDNWGIEEIILSVRMTTTMGSNK
jgi:hypothetical protein